MPGAVQTISWWSGNGAMAFRWLPRHPRAVERMLSGTRLSPRNRRGDGPAPGLGIATVEKIAINGVMAGCKPEHMPVLIALAEGLRSDGSQREDPGDEHWPQRPHGHGKRAR